MRHMHLVFGKAGFAKSGNRPRRLLQAPILKYTPKSKTPPPPELIQALEELVKGADRGGRMLENVTAIITAFSFLLIGEELAKLRRRDVRLGREGETQFVTVFIPKSETGRSGKGVYRPLVARSGRHVWCDRC